MEWSKLPKLKCKWQKWHGPASTRTAGTIAMFSQPVSYKGIEDRPPPKDRPAKAGGKDDPRV